jgi:RNA polymerase sigma factor (sigma-70 family)
VQRRYRPFSPDDQRMREVMRQISAIPLLGRDEENEHARRMLRARRLFGRLIRQLPRLERAVVAGGANTADHAWTKQRVDTCYKRLSRLAKQRPHSRAAAVAGRATRIKRVLDDTRGVLTRSHLRFVIKVAHNVGGGRMPLIDLLQEGTTGLMDAVDRFDPDRGVRLMTYAYWWITRAVTLAIENRSRMIRVPRPVRLQIAQVMMVTADLTEAFGRKPTREEIAERMDVEVARLARLREVPLNPAPLAQPHSDDREPDLLERIGDPDVANPLRAMLDSERLERLALALRDLRPIERRVLSLRFGLDGGSTHTLDQTGRQVGRTREGTRLIERRALRKLRSSPVLHGLGGNGPSRPPSVGRGRALRPR